MQWVCIESYACPHMPRAAQSMRNPATFHNGHAFESKFARDASLTEAPCRHSVWKCLLSLALQWNMRARQWLNSVGSQSLDKHSPTEQTTQHLRNTGNELCTKLCGACSACPLERTGHLDTCNSEQEICLRWMSGFFRKCWADMSNFETIKLSNLSFHNFPRNGERIDVSAIATAPSDL